MKHDDMNIYQTFLSRKSHKQSTGGFAPLSMPTNLFDFQRALVEWALLKGRAAIFADCGMGKSAMLLTWADNVVQNTHGRVLVLTPLAVGHQLVKEGEKFGIACERSRNGVLRGPIIVTNYEQLHRFQPSDFVGVVCDESSILKHFKGATQKAVTHFMAKIPYRLLCTATAAPNDYTELGTSSEALGLLGYSDMLTRFFRMHDKKRYRINEIKLGRQANSSHSARLFYRVSQAIGAWHLKGHAEGPFWRWVCSWARACRTPADLGFPDDGFLLPPLQEQEHIVEATQAADDMLFILPAFGLREEREERKRTLRERCELAARLADHDRPVVIWCHLNLEGDMLAGLISEALQVKGDDADEKKEEAYQAFVSGECRVMITKPKIGAWGLNWQHCAHVITFASHSYEQYYQSIRRCWRFGQQFPVTVDIVVAKGEQYVRENMSRKATAAATMFAALVGYMEEAQHIERGRATTVIGVPSWL